MVQRPDTRTCPFNTVDTPGVVLSTNEKYREHIAKINTDKFPDANLYPVSDDAPWFWPDENLAAIVAIRKERFESDPDRVLHISGDDSAIRAAAEQLLVEQANFLASNFPDLYTVDQDMIVNQATGDTYPIYPGRADLHPLAISGLLGQEDICLVQRTDDNREVLVAGFLATPTGWNLADFVGRDMDGIHDEIEGYFQPAGGNNKPLKNTVDKVFVRLRNTPGLKLARNNILIYQNPSQVLVPGQVPELNQEDVRDPGNEIYLRSEYETLTAISPDFAVFTIAPKVIPLAQFSDSPRLPELLKFLEYKSSSGSKQVLARKALEYLTA